MKYFIRAFTEFSFRGRVSRKAFWWFYLFYLIFFYSTAFLVALGCELMSVTNKTLAICMAILVLASTVVAISMQCKRLHDIGKADWWILCTAIPVVGSFVLLFFYLKKGDPVDNKYGPIPEEMRRPTSAGRETAEGVFRSEKVDLHYSVGEDNKVNNYCDYCGSKLELDAKKCFACGKRSHRSDTNMRAVAFVVVSAFSVLLLIGLGIVLFSPEKQTTEKMDFNSQTNLESEEPHSIPYDEYFVGIRTVTMHPDDYESSASWDDALSRLTAFCEEWMEGEMTEESLVQLMDKYCEEQGGGKIHVVLPGEFVEEVDEWCFDRTRYVGEVGLIESPYGYTFCYFLGAVRKIHTQVPGSTLSFYKLEAERERVAEAFKVDFEQGRDAYGGSAWLNDLYEGEAYLQIDVPHTKGE